ncbi:MAG: MAC/perforin domain-containing protein, partial [Pseudomonadota bacterium]
RARLATALAHADIRTFKDGDNLVPDNASVAAKRVTYGDSFYVDNRRKMEEHFAAKASASVSYGFFSGQFEASYSSTTKTDVSYQFGMVESYHQQYSLDLINRNPAALASWVKNDADYQNVPDTFTTANRKLFFNFFDKYGLYYMSRVTVGARMFYSSTVRKEYQYSARDAAAKLSIEVKAVFGASASASAEWSKAGENWASQREVSVSSIGGDNSMMNLLQPGFGGNFEEEYKAWLESADKKPAVIDFQLEPISEIFDPAKRAAIQDAMKAYIEHKLFVESKTGSCLVVVDGNEVLPAPAGSGRNLGYQLAALDRSTLKPVLAKSYATFNYWPSDTARDFLDLYAEMLTDVAPFNTSDHIIVFTAFSNFAQTAPTPAFRTFLESCGAGFGLDSWIGTRDSNRTISSCCALVHCNYAFVGIPGRGKGAGHEDFQRAGSCDTGDASWWYGSDWLDLPAPMAGVIVDLYELEDNNVAKFALGLKR